MRQRRRMAEPLFVIFLRGIHILGVWLKVFHPGCLSGTKGFPSGQFDVLLCTDPFVPQILGHVALRGGFPNLCCQI